MPHYVVRLCDYSEFLIIIVLVHESYVSRSGVPSPLVITSEPYGKFSYEFEVSWRKPETGGMRIEEYRFRLRKVRKFSYLSTVRT